MDTTPKHCRIIFYNRWRLRNDNLLAYLRVRINQGDSYKRNRNWYLFVEINRRFLFMVIFSVSFELGDTWILSIIQNMVTWINYAQNLYKSKNTLSFQNGCRKAFACQSIRKIPLLLLQHGQRQATFFQVSEKKILSREINWNMPELNLWGQFHRELTKSKITMQKKVFETQDDSETSIVCPHITLTWICESSLNH